MNTPAPDSNIIIVYTIAAVASYLLGSVPFGFLIAKAKGIDIRTKGSGNIGATNVFRTLGKGLGIFTFALDVAKGFVSAYIFPLLAAKFLELDSLSGASIICACVAVAGHNWPVFLKFKGGKGIATTAGALLGIAPAALGIGVLIWLIVFPLSRYVSLASVIAAAAIPVAGWVLYRGDGILIPSFLTLIGAMAVLRHKSNIQRLIKGTENRFEFKKKVDS